MTLPSPWLHEAIARIEADYQRSADTHLIPLRLPAFEHSGIDLYLKDESTHPTGSLKHRLARSLFLYALCNGWVREGSTIVEASSGSTAVSEAYFARLLGLPFVAVMPRSTSPEKIAQIEFHGGRCHLVESAGEVYAAARAVAAETGGHYMDQFTYAERATDWRGNNNIAESMFTQMARERHPVPRWIVVGAGTGGTSATTTKSRSASSPCAMRDAPSPEGGIEVLTAPADFETVRDALVQAGFTAEVAEITMRADVPVALSGDDAVKMQKLLDMLEDLDDTQSVYHNAELDLPA